MGRQVAPPPPPQVPTGMMQNPAWSYRGGAPQFIPDPNFKPTATPPPANNLDVLLGNFSNSAYGTSPELKNILQKYATTQDPSKYPGGPTQWTADTKNTIENYAGTFSQMFKDKVGRDPTADEYNTFFQQVVTPDQPWAVAADFTKAKEETKSSLADFFTTAAQNEATKKIQNLSTSAVAPGSAFDQWQQSYMGSLNDVEKSLQDYQSRLFEKIRPQLLTSLQSQGLLNTGALNESFTGAQKDLASEGANYVSGLRGAAAQDIANQKYQIQSNPTNYSLNNAFGSVPNLTANGQTALQNVWNQNMMNQQFDNQMKLLDYQNSNQPSLLQQYGGMMLGGAAGSFGQGFGKSFFTPTPTGIK